MEIAIDNIPIIIDYIFSTPDRHQSLAIDYIKMILNENQVKKTNNFEISFYKSEVDVNIYQIKVFINESNTKEFFILMTLDKTDGNHICDIRTTSNGHTIIAPW